jgi:NADPH:quinone reductase-like Zn-dependent oxidoreductase
MKAVRVKGFGGVDQLELVELPDPEPQPGQVRIRVEACGLNYADVMQREGFIRVDQSRRSFPASRRPVSLSRLIAGWFASDGSCRRRLSCGSWLR